jgi:hypothetical protein
MNVIRVVMLGALLVAGACSESSILEDVGTFPCALDRTCPTLYSCDVDAGVCVKSAASSVPGVGDVPIDGVCESSLACKSGEAICSLGVCSPGVSTGCAGEHAVKYSLVCLRDCSTTSCPSPLRCADVAFGTDAPHRACVGPKAAIEDSKCTDSCAPSDYTCIGGTCVIPCTAPSGGCPSGRSCTAPGADAASSGAVGCFVDCTAAGQAACPSGTTCAPTAPVDGGAGAKGCVAGG